MRPLPCSVIPLLASLGCRTPEEPPVPSSEEAGCTPARPGPLDEVLRVHHMQVASTHNSYHVEREGNTVLAWDYTMPPLDVQAGDLGVRHFELDVYQDPSDGELLVMHVPLLDDVSTCPTLGACLGDLWSFSSAFRSHGPMFVSIELKDLVPEDPSALFDAIEAEVLSVWPRECLLVPAEVQGAHTTMAEAMAETGWPTLSEARGRLGLVLLDGGAWRDALLAQEEPRLLFAEGTPGDAWAAVARLDDPIADGAAIAEAVAANLLVRTRADTDGEEARTMDTSRMEAALVSGAHLVSTDFPAPVEEGGYALQIPGGSPSRCNPATAPVGCTSEAIEALR